MFKDPEIVPTIPVDPLAVLADQNATVKARTGTTFTMTCHGGPKTVEYVKGALSPRAERYALAFAAAFYSRRLTGWIEVGPDAFSSRHPNAHYRQYNRTACRLLIPKEELRTAVYQRGISEPERLAELFDVSPAAVAYRLSFSDWKENG